jgi:catechol 2,3-dioxygenase-like lactoylglutathione lyase family enzyme
MSAPETVKFDASVPVFAVPDVVAAAEYYRDVLGFEIAGYFNDPPVFGIVWRDHIEIFFGKACFDVPHQPQTVGGIDAYIRVRGVRQLALELEKRGADILEGVTQREYNQLEVTVRDRNGYVIVFGEGT